MASKVTSPNQTGTVKWFNQPYEHRETHKTEGNYGFIILSDGSEIFVHGNDVDKESYPLTEKDQVVFDIARGKKGLKAINVVKAA